MLKPQQIAWITMVAAVISALLIGLPVLGVNLPTRQAALEPLACAIAQEGEYYGPAPQFTALIPPGVQSSSPGFENGMINTWFTEPVTGLMQPSFMVGMGNPCPYMQIGEPRVYYLPPSEVPGEPYFVVQQGPQKGQILYPYTLTSVINRGGTLAYYIIYDNGNTEHIFGTNVLQHEYGSLCRNGIDDDNDGQTDSDDGIDCGNIVVPT